MDDQDVKPARRRGTVVWLSAAGVVILALGVVLGTRLDEMSPSGQAAGRPSSAAAVDLPLSVTTTPRATTAPGPDATWLADLPVLDSSSIDEIYVESPWTIGPARVRGVTFANSISATGAWCSSAQLVFALDGRFDRFTAQVAIADNSPGTKELDFYVTADDKRVGEVENVRMTPQAIDVAVTGATRLAIGVERPATDVGGCPGPERVGAWVDPALKAVSPTTTTPSG